MRHVLPAVALLACWASVGDWVARGQDKPRANGTAEAKPAEEPESWPWKELPAVEEPRGASRTAIGEMLQSGSISDAALFDTYANFRVAQFTYRDFDAQLPELRKKLKSTLKSAAGAARERLRQVAFEKLREVAADEKYKPSVRVNALLMLSELNESEPAVGMAGGQTVPLPAVLPVLLEYVSAAKAKGGVSDAMALSAMDGVLRHAQLGIRSQDAARQVVREMLTWVELRERPASRSAEAQAFFRARAATVLEVLGATSTDRKGGEVVQALAQMMVERGTAEEPAPLWMRCQAARALAQLKLSELDNLNAALLVRSLVELAQDVSKPEGGPSRRGLKAYLQTVQAALATAVPLVAKDQQEFATAAAAKVEALLSVLEDRKVTDSELTEKLVPAHDDLAKWLQDNPLAGSLLPGLPPLATG